MIEGLSDQGSRQDDILSRACTESGVQHSENGAGMWVRETRMERVIRKKSWATGGAQESVLSMLS